MKEVRGRRGRKGKKRRKRREERKERRKEKGSKRKGRGRARKGGEEMKGRVSYGRKGNERELAQRVYIILTEKIGRGEDKRIYFTMQVLGKYLWEIK